MSDSAPKYVFIKKRTPELDEDQMSMMDIPEVSENEMDAFNEEAEIVRRMRELLPKQLKDHLSIKHKISQVKTDIKLNSIVVSSDSSVRRPVSNADALICNIKSSGKIRYVRFRRTDMSLFDSLDLPCQIESDGTFFRIPLDDFKAMLNSSEVFSVMLEEIVAKSLSLERFGCCSQYKECSAAGHCVHDDAVWGLGCTYRRNLAAGKNFYA